jgi:hypothetical protein
MFIHTWNSTYVCNALLIQRWWRRGLGSGVVSYWEHTWVDEGRETESGQGIHIILKHIYSSNRFFRPKTWVEAWHDCLNALIFIGYLPTDDFAQKCYNVSLKNLSTWRGLNPGAYDRCCYICTHNYNTTLAL